MFGPEHRWCSVFPETVPRERLALMEFCRRRTHHLTFDERSISAAIGRMVATGQQVDDELRQLFAVRWARDRWLNMVGVVQFADYESIGHKIVLDFIAENWTELAKDYVDQAMEKSVPTSRMTSAEKDCLVAKLTEGTEKIGCRSILVVQGAMIETIEFHVYGASKLHRLAFSDDCKSALKIRDAIIGNGAIISQPVSAESFGDPGSIIRYDNKPLHVYPGLPLRVRVENIGSYDVKVEAWIGVLPLASPF